MEQTVEIKQKQLVEVDSKIQSNEVENHIQEKELQKKKEQIEKAQKFISNGRRLQKVNLGSKTSLPQRLEVWSFSEQRML